MQVTSGNSQHFHGAVPFIHRSRCQMLSSSFAFGHFEQRLLQNLVEKDGTTVTFKSMPASYSTSRKSWMRLLQVLKPSLKSSQNRKRLQCLLGIQY
ncbi:unnamed protein product [Larinioides sclopetarius]|uniref:Uncharacterized protein n=1 Tax=Larinioides sclopetarius TaxID=280406 RepID=A0AAV2BY89_9ARAC